ncbi:hypothetical protein DXG01_003914 [Tephrocybe rancida]|nr:hypothetical protein DXG01_003914 [Tephrocybe rancida]
MPRAGNHWFGGWLSVGHRCVAAHSVAFTLSAAYQLNASTVKVRFQNPEMAVKYRTTTHAISTIIREEKFIGLFKGITSPLALSAFTNGLVFASYRFFMKLQLDRGDATPTLTQVTLAGIGTGVVFSFLSTPTELVKIRQQNCIQTSSSAYNTALQIYKSSGASGLYRGFTATALRDTRYGAYFFARPVALCRLPRLGDLRATMQLPRPIPGGLCSLPVELPGLVSPVPAHASTLSSLQPHLTKLVAWVVTFPFDVIKTRIQGTERGRLLASRTAQSPSTNSKRILRLDEIHPYHSTMSTILHSYRTEGGSVFFRGLAPTLIR